MFSHIVTGVADFERALRFYEAVLATLGIQQRFVDRTRPWAGWQSSPEPRPLFVIAAPFNGEPHRAGNGQMVAFLARTRAQVDLAHATALRLGGVDEGAPGLRSDYHAHYYGAYFRDTEGNKVGVACHEAPERSSP